MGHKVKVWNSYVVVNANGRILILSQEEASKLGWALVNASADAAYNDFKRNTYSKTN